MRSGGDSRAVSGSIVRPGLVATDARAINDELAADSGARFPSAPDGGRWPVREGLMDLALMRVLVLDRGGPAPGLPGPGGWIPDRPIERDHAGPLPVAAPALPPDSRRGCAGSQSDGVLSGRRCRASPDDARLPRPVDEIRHADSLTRMHGPYSIYIAL